MTQQQKDPKTGKLYNRNPTDGSGSLLAFFKSTDWPVYRMLTQFRMAKGLFDICHREIPDDGDKAAPKRHWKPHSKWKFYLSASYWLAYYPEDAGDHHRPTSFAPLLPSPRECPFTRSGRRTQPGLSLWTRPPTCTTKPDLDCVWGNTLLPCLLIGDEKQLEPAVMTQQQKDPKTGKLRHAGDHSVSRLAFFKSTGWPVYHIFSQFQIAKGLFDICHQVPRAVPAPFPFPFPFPSPAGQLAPIFVHCQGTVCYKARRSSYKINYGQAEIALNFLVSFVNETKTDPSQIGLISPYKATSVLIERLRKKKPEYLPLAAMAPTAAVDSYKGRENSIIVAVMCTTAGKGPGFTTNKHRLNVLLSRHKSGIVIFGDIDVVEPLSVNANLVKEGRVATVVWEKRNASQELIASELLGVAQDTTDARY
ncbi:unnamed protein product [Clonostachys byssicola]|uniref:DNA2/NAM7 helicase-like C-terminal domain-containing protein n=1 Tax=Clonostachys byssicola TaxID=160290 RepID=A0A9N9TZT7_9HYPO|nr:unnamed protein product [Clonostachys byssicola]